MITLLTIGFGDYAPTAEYSFYNKAGDDKNLNSTIGMKMEKFKNFGKPTHQGVDSEAVFYIYRSLGLNSDSFSILNIFSLSLDSDWFDLVSWYYFTFC